MFLKIAERWVLFILFFLERNSFCMFVRPEGNTHCIMARNDECKHSFCLFYKETPQGTFYFYWKELGIALEHIMWFYTYLV